HSHYRSNYPGARLLVIDRQVGSRSVPMGRIYLHPGVSELRLMDITLLERERGNGIGSLLLTALLEHVATRSHWEEVTLHVEPANPAQRLYRRLGFELREQRGVYDFLGWSRRK